MNSLGQIGVESACTTTDSKEAHDAFDECLRDVKASDEKEIRYLEIVIRGTLRRGTGLFAKIETELLQRFPHSRLHLLLMNLDSDDAVFRGKLDRVTGTPMNLFEEMRSSFLYCIELMKRHPGRIRLGLYNRHPMARILLTSESVMYQPFHLGERIGVSPLDTVPRAVGAMPIILRCKKGSQIYALADNQFATYEKQATYVQDGPATRESGLQVVVNSEATVVDYLNRVKDRWRRQGFTLD